MGKHIGSRLGQVEDSAIYDYPQKARIIKIRVSINIEEPIRPGMFIGNPKDEINWVDFRYENLPMFCFNCGLVGHNEDKCEIPSLILPEEGTNPRGPWLRSNIYGKRVHDNRDKRFNSNPTQSISGGKFSSIPQEMLDMMAQMKLEEESVNKSPNGTKVNHSNHTSTTNLHQQTPTISKRKFQGALTPTSKVTQLTNGNGITSPVPTNYQMVSPVDQANQSL
jgi:hypothetical protein